MSLCNVFNLVYNIFSDFWRSTQTPTHLQSTSQSMRWRTVLICSPAPSSDQAWVSIKVLCTFVGNAFYSINSFPYSKRKHRFTCYCASWIHTHWHPTTLCCLPTMRFSVVGRYSNNLDPQRSSTNYVPRSNWYIDGPAACRFNWYTFSYGYLQLFLLLYVR